MKLTRRVADELAGRVVDAAIEAGIVPAANPEPPDWARFAAFRHHVEEAFTVPETSITPLLARVLYGIAHAARPRRVLGIGTYAGNGVVWLLGPGFADNGTYLADAAAALDVDGDATELARGNFARLGTLPAVDCLTLDGHRAAAELDAGWDAVWLDAEDPDAGKAVYLTLLDALRPALAPGCLVLAHDVCVPKFREQLAPYLAAVRRPEEFAGSVSLELDECGLEVSRLR